MSADTMTDLPVRIWAGPDEHRPRVGYWYSERTSAQVPYYASPFVWRLRSYAVHDDSCTTNRYPHKAECSCGLKAALAQMEGG